MINYKDIVLLLLSWVLLLFCFFILLVFEAHFAYYGALIIGFYILHYRIKRTKKISQYVNPEFRKMGYRILSEKPVPFSELDFSITPAIAINGIPVSRYGYIRQFGRIFIVENQTGDKFRIKATCTKKWSGEIDIEVLNKKSLTEY